jgi:hypothetical protein
MTRIPIGDVLEWIGAALLISAAAIWSGLVLSLAVAGVWLVYVAQCFASDNITIGTSKENQK